MHVLPQLRKIEEKHPQEIVVIGVHSGKYDAERKTENIRQAVLRLEVEHPVVNDRFFRIWKAYSVSAWPTIVLVDPEGRYIGSNPGEITVEMFEPILQSVIADYDRRGLLDRRPIQFPFLKDSEPERTLNFPGKVLFSPPDRLFIADSNHNRVLITRLDGDYRRTHIEAAIGSGQRSFSDGSFQSSSFHHPQGMALAGNTLYIADSENHAIRAANLDTGKVRTVAGTGSQGWDRSGGPGLRTSLSSPWDVVLNGSNLYIAMAGLHQLWLLDLSNWEVHPFAGNGREAIDDNALDRATLAQPMGIVSDGKALYFCDSESSSVRIAGMDSNGRVTTLVGTGLFDFGDRDGTGKDVLLQHNQGITLEGGLLYVADTYNNKIKVLNPQTKECLTLLGTGEPGTADGLTQQFDEPAGVCAGSGHLFIADTNNHAIRVANLATREVWTLEVE